jgi:UrcA family protein
MRKAIALIAALCLAAPVAAQNGARPEPVVIKVSYDDLDLTNSEDASTLMVRMLSAMESICGKRPNPKILERNESFALCKRMLDTSATDVRVKGAFRAALAKL